MSVTHIFTIVFVLLGLVSAGSMSVFFKSKVLFVIIVLVVIAIAIALNTVIDVEAFLEPFLYAYSVLESIE